MASTQETNYEILNKLTLRPQAQARSYICSDPDKLQLIILSTKTSLHLEKWNFSFKCIYYP